MGLLEERDLGMVPSILEFYKGKTIFITGGSGFMGKVLIEKLLYSCTDLDRIYLLLRTKKGVNSDDRLAQLYSSMCFNRLRTDKPGVFESKVFVVAGDVSEIGLGLSIEDRNLLTDQVNIIFHVAASVRFDDPLTYAAKLNLRGTKEVVELCKEIRNLSVIVYVSTVYSNTNRNVIDEVMYPPHANWRETLHICENVDEHTLRVMTSKYLGKIPNTYTFTKQLAEHVVYEEAGKLPAVIIRPSIVTGSAKEPSPGWIESFNGPMGLLVASGKGILRSVYTKPDLICDNIPVDVSIKHFIAAAWIRGTKLLNESDDIPIYNCCSNKLFTFTMYELFEIGRNLMPSMPFHTVLWNRGGSITTSKTWHYIRVLLFHLLPALFIDGILMAIGRKPILTKIQRRIYLGTMALQYYVTTKLDFLNKNFILLRSCIKEEDKKDFYYDLENIDSYEYYKFAMMGCKKYLLNEKEEDQSKAVANFKRMVVLDYVVRCLFFGVVFWCIFKTEYVQKNVCDNVLSILFHYL